MPRLDITLAGKEVDDLRDSIAKAGALFEKFMAELNVLTNQGADIVFSRPFTVQKGSKIHITLLELVSGNAGIISMIEECAEDFDRLQRLLMEIENFRFRADVPPNCRSLDIHFDPRCMYEDRPLPWEITGREVPAIAPLNLLSLTAEQNLKLNERAADLLRQCIDDDTVERGMVMEDSGRVIVRARQLNRLAPIPHVFFYDFNRGTIRIHYHPGTEWFSREDLSAFYSCDNVRIEGVICKDGSTHILEKTASYSKERFGEALNKFKNTTCILGQIDNCGIAYYRNGRLEET